MFIVGWLAILVLRANEVVIPGAVSFIVGALAIAEISLYTVAFLIVVLGVISTRRN